MIRTYSFALMSWVLIGAPAKSQTFEAVAFFAGFPAEINVTGVTDDGNTVVGFYRTPFEDAATFRWTREAGFDVLPMPIDASGMLNEDNRGFAISGDGSTVVGSTAPELESVGMTQAVSWRGTDPAVFIGDFPGGAFGSEARGVSRDGNVIVGVGSTASGNRAFRLDSLGELQNLGVLNPDGAFRNSIAMGVSGDGRFVVGTSTSSDSITEAFRWSEETGMQGLGTLGGGLAISVAEAASQDGSVVVGSSDGQAFRWTEENGMAGLGNLLGGTVASAYDVTPDGKIVVGSSESDHGTDGFIWRESTGMVSLTDLMLHEFDIDLTDWSVLIIRGISADGKTLVGDGFPPTGFRRVGWIATIPSPSTLFVLFAGMGFAKSRRR